MARTHQARGGLEAGSPAAGGGRSASGAPGAPPGRARLLPPRAGTALLAALAVAALLQVALVARHTLAAWAPGLRPALSALAGMVGLRVEPPRRLSQLTLEGFDLRAGVEPSQLVLTAVLRNAGRLPVQWPAMELTLSDEAGAVVVRRALLPAQYLRMTPQQLDAGIEPRSEQSVRLVLEAVPATAPAGYTVSLFYP